MASKLQQQPITQSAYRPEIDGLRALAVMAVIINHFSKDLLPSGYLGVDIFFVISGYVITLSLANHRSESFRTFILGFYARRVKRLLPALLVFVLLTSLALCFFNPQPGVSLGIGRRALFGLSNISLYQSSTDYFAPSTDLNPFTHTWSLAVEEQFYVLFPLLIWFSGFGRSKRAGKRNLFALTALLSLASLAAFIWLYQRDQPAAYFLMPARLWEIGAGCLLFIGLKKNQAALTYSSHLVPGLFLGMIVATFFLSKNQGLIGTILVVPLTAGLIATLKEGSAGFSFLTLKPMIFIGLISYSLYLWHWGVLSISRWTIGIHWWTAPIQICAILVLGYSSYHWIEQPWRNRLIKTPKIFIILSGASLIGIAQLVIGWLSGPAFSMYLGSTDDAGKKLKHQTDERNTPYCNIFNDSKNSTRISSKCGITPSIKRPTIYLLGDSHAGQFIISITNYARSHNYNTRSIIGNSCLFPASKATASEQKCFDLQRQVQNSLIPKVKKDDIIIIGNALYLRFKPNLSNKNQVRTSDQDPAGDDTALSFTKEFQDLSKSIESNGGKVVLYIDSVQFPSLDDYPAGGCKREWFRPILPEQCFTSMAMHKSDIDRNFKWRNQWRNDNNRFVWSAYRHATDCVGDRCSALNYADSNHFLPETADYHFKRFAASKQSPFGSQ